MYAAAGFSPTNRESVREWLQQFDGCEAEFALEGTTGWRFVAEGRDADVKRLRATAWIRNRPPNPERVARGCLSGRGSPHLRGTRSSGVISEFEAQEFRHAHQAQERPQDARHGALVVVANKFR